MRSNIVLIDDKEYRFSILSENKIQLEYSIPITCNGIFISNIKVKSKYKKTQPSTLIVPLWSYLYPKPRFFNLLSMFYGIKKTNIKFKYSNKVSFNFISEGQLYNMSNLLESIEFNDISWYRNFQLKNLLSVNK